MSTDGTGEGTNDSADQLPPLDDEETKVLEQDVDDRYPDEMTDPDAQSAEVADPDADDPHPAVPPPKSN
jgi:hypothetical protein